MSSEGYRRLVMAALLCQPIRGFNRSKHAGSNRRPAPLWRRWYNDRHAAPSQRSAIGELSGLSYRRKLTILAPAVFGRGDRVDDRGDDTAALHGKRGSCA